MNRADSAYAESALSDFWMGRFSNKVTSKFFLRISQKQKYNPACNAKTMLTKRVRPAELCEFVRANHLLNRLLQSEVLVIAMDRAVGENT